MTPLTFSIIEKNSPYCHCTIGCNETTAKNHIRKQLLLKSSGHHIENNPVHYFSLNCEYLSHQSKKVHAGLGLLETLNYPFCVSVTVNSVCLVMDWRPVQGPAHTGDWHQQIPAEGWT